ncbi:MAG TPA: OmpA family protein [Polyangiaceae bacterium]|jgi:chemotaxis protein MotB|nr:OmpA family protein [Polyangiaceae bacterium]
MASWDSAADLGPYAKRGTNWGRVFVLILLVGIGTFVAAYYLPLYRAQQKLSAEYRELGQKSQSLTDSATKAQAELKSVTAERDQLQAEHDKRESAKKTEGAGLDRVTADLSTKLDKLVKKGSAVVTVNNGALLVALDGASLFTPQKLELSAAGKATLCEIAKSTQSFSLRINGSMLEDATMPAGLESSLGNPWALSAARAAAVAQALEEKCAFPAAQLSAIGNGKHDPFLSALATLKAPERIELEFRPH